LRFEFSKDNEKNNKKYNKKRNIRKNIKRKGKIKTNMPKNNDVFSCKNTSKINKSSI
jgi:hypothetical protein